MLDINEMRERNTDTALKIQETLVDLDCAVRYNHSKPDIDKAVMNFNKYRLFDWIKHEVPARSEKYSTMYKSKPGFDKYYSMPNLSDYDINEIFWRLCTSAEFIYSGLENIFKFIQDHDGNLYSACKDVNVLYLPYDKKIDLVLYIIDYTLDDLVFIHNEDIFNPTSAFHQAIKYEGLQLPQSDLNHLFAIAIIDDYNTMYITEDKLREDKFITPEKFNTIITWAHQHGILLLNEDKVLYKCKGLHNQFCSQYYRQLGRSLALDNIRRPQYYDGCHLLYSLVEKLPSDEKDVFISLYSLGVDENAYMDQLTASGKNAKKLIDKTIEDIVELLKPELIDYWKKTTSFF